MSLPKPGRKFWYIFPVVILALLASWYYFSNSGKSGPAVTTKVLYGDFSINVTTSGELEAKNSENILGPPGLREVRIWQVQISDIIPEGTIVDSGQYVATLDRTEITNRLKDLESELEKLESQFV